MNDEWGEWSYTATWTSGVGGTTGITHSISAGAGNMLHIMELKASAAIAATGTLDGVLVDEDGVVIVSFFDLAAAAAPVGTIPRLNDDVISTSSADEAASTGGVVLAGADLRVQVLPGNLAAADTVTIVIKAKCLKGPGAVTTVKTGLYTEVIAVNEVY